MAYLIALDDGHGLGPKPTLGKRTPNISGVGVIYENQFNRAVVNYLDTELKRCGFRTILVAPTDVDTPLSTRIATANRAKADAYISCHYNAGGGAGVETFYHTGSSRGRRLATCIHNQVTKGTPQKNRGLKSGNHLWVIRKTNMPATLIEFGFMDDPGLVEAKRMIDPAFQKECAVETAKGICEYFGVSYSTSSSSASSTSMPSSYPGSLIRKGSRGEYVKMIQRALGGLSVDGIFGPKTQNAVKVFQRKNGLSVDGIVGPLTWNKLFP
ncbi:N-acetylmuramoyl-L-alanine amidase [Thermoactinomyces sp. DSM 45892]|uniref:N-acetylmuramoyl-L-alanine amidase n=1 Tax=Thermoactinomyces sp. DSM 45892 TaxID=1882753 RepID=UPI000895AC6A|nr:N-acetylmuramoyl-L-alanine amidase [Thermoactinomyces sp. DSM 45892]SDY23542.1 N-acetylmuramoyl-L-alanine amidase [Thermoactinomyces sp. DSM 45892]